MGIAIISLMVNLPFFFAILFFKNVPLEMIRFLIGVFVATHLMGGFVIKTFLLFMDKTLNSLE